jgi:hypothetical protein
LSQIHLYFDEDAVAGLRSRGTNILTAFEAGMVSRGDEDHLGLAAGQGRVLYSFNDRDFYRIHTEWITSQRTTRASSLPSSNGYSIGEQIRSLSRLRETLSAEDMRNRVEFLSGW